MRIIEQMSVYPDSVGCLIHNIIDQMDLSEQCIKGYPLV